MFGWIVSKTFSARFLVYGCLIAFGAGCGVTHWVHGKFDRAQEVDTYRTVLRHANDTQNKLRPIEERNAQIRALQEAVASAIQRELPRHAEPHKDPLCNLPIGVVRLLNASRDPRATEASVSATASVSDAEAGAASTVTRDDLVRSDADIAARYKKLAADYEALIEHANTVQEQMDNYR